MLLLPSANLAAGSSVMGGLRRVPGPVDIPRDDRIERRVDALRSREQPVEYLTA